MRAWIRELRVPQYYKNLVVFIPLVFAIKLFDVTSVIKVLITFIALCAVSSSNYIINDVIDIKRDRKHPEKMRRPIASGEIKITTGLIGAIILFLSSILLSYYVKPTLVIWILGLFVSTQAYSLLLKKIALVDVQVIALNFLIRTTAGSIAISVPTTPWLFITMYFIAPLLALGKRKGEMLSLGLRAKQHRTVYNVYTQELLNGLINMVGGILILCYSLYSFMRFENNELLIITVPIITFIVVRYLYFIYSNHEIARRTEKIFRDKQTVAALFLWVITSILILY